MFCYLHLIFQTLFGRNVAIDSLLTTGSKTIGNGHFMENFYLNRIDFLCG